MATNTNFTSLKQDITRYIERGGSPITDPTVYDQIPRLINAAERRIMNALKLQGTIEPLQDPSGLVIGTAIITKPDRWRQTISLWYGAGTGKNTRTALLPRSYEFCRSYWPDDSLTSPPLFYADYDYQHWLVSPTPDLIYPLEALCYMQPEYLDNSNQTNFFTDYIPNLLLYGSLLEATPFLKDDQRIPTWQTYWDREVAALNPQDLQKIMDRTSERSKP